MPQSNPPERRSLLPQISANKNRAAWVGVSLTALGMIVAAILYVTTALASTKAWAAEEDQVTQSIMKTELKENYVNNVQYIKDITILDERQQQIKKDVGDIKSMLKDMRDDMREDTRGRNSRSRYERDDDR